MLTVAQLLQPLARHRTDEIVVTTMSVAAPWARLSDGTLDFAMVERSSGQAPPFGLGLALARPASMRANGHTNWYGQQAGEPRRPIETAGEQECAG